MPAHVTAQIEAHNRFLAYGGHPKGGSVERYVIGQILALVAAHS